MAKVDEIIGVEFLLPPSPGYERILNPEAISFVTDLHRRFNRQRLKLLGLRAERQSRFDMGEKPTFLAQTQHIRDGEWTVASLPQDLLDRRVEITGPVERKMIINALNSGARVFMADFEDSNAPSLANQIDGQIN